ncbi:hypothetical protein TorRG33x02_249160 [Trema orientale]|uniref:Rapid ALkalinization Factor n=1 Tax=Trema orientale TaxID=63057 RepID=A0A2P5DK56_TREOI|nr:hypothetical protein TorRG33x02_249160 [Trema orientale]
MPRNLFITALSVVMTSVIVLNATGQCGASGTMPLKSFGNASTRSICDDGHGEECLIAQLEVDLEFQMPSETSRRVLDGIKSIYKGLDPKRNGGCGVGNQASCSGKKTLSSYLHPLCGKYDRSCPP